MKLRNLLFGRVLDEDFVVEISSISGAALVIETRLDKAHADHDGCFSDARVYCQNVEMLGPQTALLNVCRGLLLKDFAAANRCGRALWRGSV